MRFLYVLIAVLVFVPRLAGANELLRLYQIAQTNDAKFAAADHARDAAFEAKPQARALWLPQLTASGTVNPTHRHFISTAGGAASQAFPVTQEFGTTTTGKVQVSQRLFDLGAWAQLKQSDSQVALAVATFRNAEQDLLLRVTQAYFNVLSGTDNLRFIDAQNKAQERQLEQAKKRFEVGLSAITDVQDAQARYDLTVAQKIDAERQLDSARFALEEIIGPGVPANEVPLKEEIPLSGPDPSDLKVWISGASEANPNILSSEAQAEIARRDVQRARAGHLPTLNLVGGESYSNTNKLVFGNKVVVDSATIQLDIPIFSGFATQSRVHQSKETYKQREAELEAARRAAERQTRDAYRAVMAGVLRVKALKTAVVSNTTALEASETGLEVGTRTQVDVLDAEQRLYSAQNDYAKARYDYLVSILQLKAQAGRLTEADLTEIDRLLTSATK